MEIKIVFGLGLVAILIIAIIVLISNPIQKEEAKSKIKLEVTPTPTVSALAYKRDQYYNLPKETFDKLPDIPFDFEPTRQLFETGQLSLKSISKEYYLQPEFFPNFKTSGINLMLDYPKDMEAKNGYGVYPSEYILKANENGKYEIRFLVYSSWGVVSYQGVSLQKSYQQTASMDKNYFPDGTRSVIQDINYAKDHIKVVSITPSETILEPSYSKWNLIWDAQGRLIPTFVKPHFETGWVKEVIMVLDIENLKPGKYQVGVNIGTPSDKSNEEWFNKYRTLYRVGGGYSIGKDWFNLFIVKE